jgi:hypothetical protein
MDHSYQEKKGLLLYDAIQCTTIIFHNNLNILKYEFYQKLQVLLYEICEHNIKITNYIHS